MPTLDQLPDLINKIFDVLDLLVVRFGLFGLAAIGVYTILKKHPS